MILPKETRNSKLDPSEIPDSSLPNMTKICVKYDSQTSVPGPTNYVEPAVDKDIRRRNSLNADTFLFAPFLAKDE